MVNMSALGADDSRFDSAAPDQTKMLRNVINFLKNLHVSAT